MSIPAAALGLALAACALPAASQPRVFPGAAERREDAQALCRFVAEEYAYLDRKALDWPRTCAHFAPLAERASDEKAFIGALESLLAQLHDSHAHLGTNTMASPRLVPSQADAMAAWVDGRARVTDVREDSAAARAGLAPGDEIVTIDDVPVARAAAVHEPLFLDGDRAEARDWALRIALAGRHEASQVRLGVRSRGATRTVAYSPAHPKSANRLEASMQDGIAHLRIRNSLGEAALVKDIDAALDRFADARGLVLDLRDTPSGGNSTVARGILGRFVDRLAPYQRHELVSEFRATGIRRIWTESVAPRGVKFRGSVVVLAGPWTGSMGEGIAIGLNAARGAPVLGRPMARLLGALGEISLPRSHIVARIPVETLHHVDGTPREVFVPCAVEPGGEGDGELAKARRLAAWLAQRDGPNPLGAKSCAGVPST
ncbi:MAG: PDZ domain-containing protein [Betaproteobacteria bacterium]|nr:PDZ domain-containing protein [Betaproteobacteria bacterium]